MAKYQYKVQGVDYDVEISEVEGTLAKVNVNGIDFEVELKQPISVGNQIKKIKPVAPAAAPVVGEAPKAEAAPAPVQAGSGTKVLSPLPGTITDIPVKVGDAVAVGDTVIVLEAMKMKGLVAEISPAAEADGDKVIDENVKISFYYRADGVTLDEASQEFLSAFKNYYPGIEFGEPDLVNIESQKTTLVAYDFTSDEGKTSGTLYVATRSMAHYAILLTHKTDYAGYNEYEEEIVKLLRTFRLTVFED